MKKTNTNIPEANELSTFQKILLVINWLSLVGFACYGFYKAYMKLCLWILRRIEIMDVRLKDHFKKVICKHNPDLIDDGIDEVM